MQPSIKSLTLLLVFSAATTLLPAQTNRRAIVELSTETVDKALTTGLRPGTETLSQLAATGDVSLDVINRMSDPDDRRQSAACMRVIEAVAEFSLRPEGKPTIDKVRSGLRKAIDRCDDLERRKQLMTLLAKYGNTEDAAHLCQYLSDPSTNSAAISTLAAMPGIDNYIDSLISNSAKPDAQLVVVSKMRSGQLSSNNASAKKVTGWTRPKKLPSWTETLNDAVDNLRRQPQAQADSLLQLPDVQTALPQLLDLARNSEGAQRDAVLARYLHVAENMQVNPTERYLLLRAANELVENDDLRRKLIIDFGTTQSVQALAIVRPYYDLKAFADAVAITTVNVLKNNADANGGRHVRNMLIAAKQAYVRHYDEEGSGEAIDAIFDALDNCADQGYNLSPSHTSMGKKGFWNMTDERANLALAFDWKAEGALTVTLRSMPVLTLDRHMGLRLAGSNKWYSYKTCGEWDTANIHLTDGKLSVSVNGYTLVTDAPLVNPEQGQPVNQTGYVAFTADENGAVVEQVCIKPL